MSKHATSLKTLKDIVNYYDDCRSPLTGMPDHSQLPKEIIIHILTYVDKYLPAIIYPQDCGLQSTNMDTYILHNDLIFRFSRTEPEYETFFGYYVVCIRTHSTVSICRHGIIRGSFFQWSTNGLTVRGIIWPQRVVSPSIRFTQKGLVPHEMFNRHESTPSIVDDNLGGHVVVIMDGMLRTVPVNTPVKPLNTIVATMNRLRYL